MVGSQSNQSTAGGSRVRPVEFAANQCRGVRTPAAVVRDARDGESFFAAAIGTGHGLLKVFTAGCVIHPGRGHPIRGPSSMLDGLRSTRRRTRKGYAMLCSAAAS